MSHCELILNYLQDGKEHFIRDIMRDLKPTCLNWAVRSRIADINRKLKTEGKFIINSFTKPETKAESWYKLEMIKTELF